MKKIILSLLLLIPACGVMAQSADVKAKLKAESTGVQKKLKAAAKPMTKQEIQQATRPLFEQLQALPQTEDAEKKAKTLIVNFVKANKNDAGVAMLTSYLPQMMDADEFTALVNSNKYWKENERVKAVLTVMDAKKATSEGKPFAVFSAEYEGQETKLSDYVGKGQYVLVDFWASWCGPCKAEIPNLINVYNKYKEKGLVVLGVATWDEPKNTQKAIEELGIPYPQMMNAQKAGSDAYGIQGIPQIILFGPDGTILKRDLRGAAIDKTIGEYLK